MVFRGVGLSPPAASPENLFDRTRGIYVNATGNGRGWERPVTVEQIDPASRRARPTPQ